MRMTKQVVILSAELSTLSEAENRDRTSKLFAVIGDLFYNRAYPAIGHYKGTKEQSVIVTIRNEAELEVLQGYAFKNFDQESILHQDSNGACHLLGANGSSELLGRLTRTSEQSIIDDGTENYTEVKGKFYVTRRWS